MKESDQILMDQVKAGDKRKMGTLFERHNKDLFSYFYRMTKDRVKSEDLVQNVFLRMLKYAHNYKGDGKFVYWMFSIARNVWIDDHRKHANMKNTKDLESVNQDYLKDNVNLEKNFEQKERKRILEYALDQISPEKKEAIVLSRHHDMKYKEIATLTNCSENTVKSRIKRGIVELQQIVQAIQPN